MRPTILLTSLLAAYVSAQAATTTDDTIGGLFTSVVSIGTSAIGSAASGGASIISSQFSEVSSDVQSAISTGKGAFSSKVSSVQSDLNSKISSAAGSGSAVAASSTAGSNPMALPAVGGLLGGALAVVGML